MAKCGWTASGTTRLQAKDDTGYCSGSVASRSHRSPFSRSTSAGPPDRDRQGHAGQPVGDLKKDDFTVFDNGATQTITLFERHTSQPLSVAILVDISGSTGKEMKYRPTRSTVSAGVVQGRQSG